VVISDKAQIAKTNAANVLATFREARTKIRSTTWILLAACFFHGNASAAGDDQFTALIKQRIEAFSDASSRGDQAAMNNLFDDDVLFSSGNGTVDRDPQRDKSDTTAALLRKQAQAFCDADQRRDLVAMTSYLGDEVLFINEDGVVSERRDSLSGAPAAAPKGISSTVTLTDWILHYSGDVAVASFVDDQVVHYDTQDLNRKFLTVETWIKSAKGWQLIASQTIPLHQDPSPLILPSDVLDEYVGSYSGGPGLAVTISRDGNKLSASTNGGKAVVYDAEARDIFFTPGMPPGSPRPRITFQRDKNGHIAGYVSNRGLVLTRGEKSNPAAPAGDPATAQQAISSTILPAADLVVHRSGDVAVATFIHERVTHYYGQVLHTKYRSTETWIKRGAEWKMLTLQSRELDGPSPSAIGIEAGPSPAGRLTH